MSEELEIECIGEPENPIPTSVYEVTQVEYEDAFSKAEAIVKVAKELEKLSKDCFCKLPFCVTVEAEAMGANIIMDRKYEVPTVGSYVYESLEEIERIADIDLNTGRILQVLEAIEKLTLQGEDVILNVEGPLTILGLLVRSRYLYKGLIKSPNKIMELSEQIIQNEVKFIKEGIKRGAKIISYADPTVSYDLVSSDIYKNLCGRVSYKLLQAIEKDIIGCVVHLCNRTSVGFEKSGFCTSEKIDVKEGLTYGEALKSVIEDESIKFIGHGCLQQSAYPMKRNYLYKLNLI